MAQENIIIIGGGPAGLAAAIYAARANLHPLVIAGSPPGGQLTLTTDVENYPGFEAIMGPDLIIKMRAHAEKFGTRFIDDNILSVDFSKKPFSMKLATNNEVISDTVLITTGATAMWLGIESETRLRGKGVSACATCDGFFFKNKIVGVIGGGDTAMEEALTLTKFAEKVYIFHRRDSFRASKIMQQRVLEHSKIEVVWNVTVEEVLGNEKVEGARLSNGKNIDLQGLFLAIGHQPNTGFLKNSGIQINKKGYIVTSGWYAWEKAKNNVEGLNFSNYNFHYQHMTSVDGVFAAGDVVDYVYRQAATAVGMGVAAVLEVERYLME